MWKPGDGLFGRKRGPGFRRKCVDEASTHLALNPSYRSRPFLPSLNFQKCLSSAQTTGGSTMSRKRPQSEVNRRKFLAGAAVAGAATSATVAKAGTPPIGAAKIPT